MTLIQRTTADLAAILTTLLETDHAPESILYLGLGSDIGRWNNVRHVLGSNKLVTIDGHRVSLTATGRALAREIEAAIPTTTKGV